MSRISNVEKAKYTRIGNQDDCHYCGLPAGLDDLTPSSNASEYGKALFTDQWTISRVCRKCWGKIYTANIAGGGLKYGVHAGCMTVNQKKTLIGGEPITSGLFIYSSAFGMIAPKDMMQISETQFVYNTKVFSDIEMIGLQGALAVKSMNLAIHIVEAAFSGAMASGLLEIEREAEYRSMLRL